jgi:catechol 2,3-dioxygenase-like lactoylglutathione lyase family enzyme
MLTERRVHTTIPAADMERAERWYEEKLGFKPIRKLPGGSFYRAGDNSQFTIYPTPIAGKAPQTIMGFNTPDVEAEVRELKARGVVFEEYDYPTLKTVNSIATMGQVKSAWFKDSEGNILGIVQIPD